jgi:hypothetical protein
MLLPTSGFAVWMTQHASPASDVYTCIACGAMRCDAIEQHIFAVKYMITFHFISLLS